jgi:hypothetical protein
MNRSITRALRACLGLLALLLVARSAVEARLAGPPRTEAGAIAPGPAVSQDKRAELMALKLDYAKNVLEGLTLERLDLVAENARDLKLMSAAAEWEPAVVPGPRYLDFTREFQRIADAMAEHASEGNLDAATLSYVQLTMNCVDCHKYVRANDP